MVPRYSRGAVIRPGRPWSPLDYGIRVAISKNVRQRSVGQMVQKLQAFWSYLGFVRDGAPVTLSL